MVQAGFGQGFSQGFCQGFGLVQVRLGKATKLPKLTSAIFGTIMAILLCLIPISVS